MTYEQILKKINDEAGRSAMAHGVSLNLARARHQKEIVKQLSAEARRVLDEASLIVGKARSAKRNLTSAEDEAVDRKIQEAESLQCAGKKHQEMYENLLEEEPSNMNTHFGRPNFDNEQVAMGSPQFEQDPKRGFSSPADYFKAVMNASGGGPMPDNLKSLAIGSDEAGVYSDAHGGFLVPDALVADVKSVGTVDPLDQYVQKITLSGPVVKIPARVDKNHATSVSSGLQFYRRAETQTVSSSRLELELINLAADTLMGISYATEEVLSDSAVPFMQLLSRSFRDELNSKLMSERLSGTGVGQFLGALNSPCLITASAETGQGANTIVYKNLVNMRARSWGYDRAVWLANPTTLPQLMTMTDPAGRLVWQASARDGEPEVLLSRPIIFDEHLPALGTVGDILLGTWGEYLQGTLGGDMNAAESIHVRFVNHERTFKFWTRNAGAPWWRSVLTPKNGDTLSPFVTLSGTRT